MRVAPASTSSSGSGAPKTRLPFTPADGEEEDDFQYDNDRDGYMYDSDPGAAEPLLDSSVKKNIHEQLFTNPDKWWHYRLTSLLYACGFFFAFAAGFTNVVYLVRYNVFSAVPMGNFIRYGVAVSENFSAIGDDVKELKTELDEDEYAQAKRIDRVVLGNGSVLLSAILFNAVGALLADLILKRVPRYAGLVLAVVTVVFEIVSALHYVFYYLPAGKDGRGHAVPHHERCFPVGLMLGAVAGGAQNYFTGRGAIKVNTVGLTGVIQRVPPLFAELCCFQGQSAVAGWCGCFRFLCCCCPYTGDHWSRSSLFLCVKDRQRYCVLKHLLAALVRPSNLTVQLLGRTRSQ